MTTYSRVEHGSHGENIPWMGLKTAERAADYVRLPHSPTPLNPFKFNRDGKPYLVSSLETIDRILDQAQETQMAKNAPDYVRELMPVSVRGALILRFQEANAKVATDRTPLDLFYKAEMGSATPEELITLLVEDPSFSSVEAAKLSDPYGLHGPEQMDRVVTGALEKFDFRVSESPEVRYILAGADNMQDPRAVNIVRKVNLGKIHGTSGPLQVVKRDSYLLDLASNPEFTDVRKECRRFISGANRENTDSFGGKPVRYDRDMLPVVLEEGIENYDDYVYPAVSSYYVHTLS